MTLSRRSSADEQGAILILTLFFITTLGILITSLLTQGWDTMGATVNLRQATQIQYNADGTVDAAIAALRIPFNSFGLAPASPFQFSECPGMTGTPWPKSADGSWTVGAAKLWPVCAPVSVPTLGQVVVVILACPTAPPGVPTPPGPWTPSLGCVDQTSNPPLTKSTALLRADVTFTQQLDTTLAATVTITSWSSFYGGGTS